MGRLFTVLLLTLLCTLPAAPVGAAEADPVSRANEILLELQRYNAQLEDLESQFGPFDNSLIEPLSSIVVLLEEQGDYRAALDVQTRQLGLMRTVLGLQSPALIPVLESIIQNHLQLNDWQAVTDNLELIQLIVASSYGADSDEALESLDDQAQWALSRVTLETNNQDQARSFMRAREVYDLIVDRAEERFGEDSPELYVWYYKRAQNLAVLVGLLNTDDSLGSEVLDEVIREDGFGRLEQGNNVGAFSSRATFGTNRRFAIVDGDSVLGVAYLRQGRAMVKDIGDIAESLGDLETQGMMEIYRGDYNVMMEQSSGSRNYRDARELLMQAGIDADRIDQFFATPMPLPMPRLFTRFADLEAFQQQRLARTGVAAEDLTHLGIFRAWAEAAPALQLPVSDNPLFNFALPQHSVDLKFRLSARGNTSSIDVISAQPPERRVEREGWRALRSIRFRPYFSDGRTRALRDLQIRYEFAAVDD